MPLVGTVRAGPSVPSERMPWSSRTLPNAPEVDRDRDDPLNPCTRRASSTPDTWDDFAALVEANNGVWGGCWCMGFHPEGVGKGQHRRREPRGQAGARARRHRAPDARLRRRRLRRLVPVRLARRGRDIKNPKAYDAELDRAARLADRLHLHRQAPPRQRASPGPRWRRCSPPSRQAGGGLVEAYPEQVEGRPPQRGAYFHTGPEDLFEEFGFERDRRIAKWRWVMRRRVGGLTDPAAPASGSTFSPDARSFTIAPQRFRCEGEGSRIGRKSCGQSSSGKRWMISCRPGPTPIAETRAPISSSTRST